MCEKKRQEKEKEQKEKKMAASLSYQVPPLSNL